MAAVTRDGGRERGGPPGPSSLAAAAQNDVSQYRWIILIGLITASIMEVLDTTIVNVALPQMAGNLNATTDEIAWVSTGYILSNVVVLPMTAWLSGRFGRRNYLSFSILLFVIASFFCGTANTLGLLVFWRIIQGAGGAALLSTAQATLREIFPRDQQGMVQSIFIMGIIVAPTVGPTLGGYITDNYNWGWVFFINLPIGAVSLAIVYSLLTDSQFARRTAGVDWLGISLLTVGLGSLQYVLEEGERYDWFEDATITRLSVLSAVCLVSFVAWAVSPRNKNPIVEFGILKNRGFTFGLVLFLALGFGLYGGVFIFPLFAQNVLGFTPTTTGLLLLPGGLATAFGAIVCGRLLNGSKRIIGPQPLILLGVVLFCWSMWDLGHLTTLSGEPDTRIGLIVRGLGLGFLFTPINQAIFTALHGREIAQGSSLINLARQLGGSFGIAVLNTYITNQTKFHRYDLVSHLTPGDPAYLARTAAASANLTANGYSHAAAAAGAARLLDHTIQAQAQVMAFNDGFLLLGVSFLIALPSVFLLPRTKSGGSAAAGAGH